MDRDRWKRNLVLGFFIYHLLAVGVLSVPAPTGARAKEVWTDPQTRAQILGWTGPLDRLGLTHGPDERVALARRVSVSVLDLRDLLIAPFTPYTRSVGAGQGWQMFATINEEPARLAVELRREPDGAWEMIYLARDPARGWRRALLDEERTRAISNDWSWERDRADYRRFARWLALRAAEDFPTATGLRVSMLRAKLPTPEQLASGDKPPEKPTWVETFALAPLRAEAGP